MNMHLRAVLGLLLIAVLLRSVELWSKISQAATSITTNPSHTNEKIDTFNSSLMFVENMGQFDSHTRFRVLGTQATMGLSEDGLLITLLGSAKTNQGGGDGLSNATDTKDSKRSRGVNVKISFVDANPHPSIEPFNRLETKISYFTGSNPSQWKPDIPVWGGIRYVGLYPGVDLEISSNNVFWNWRLSQDVSRVPQSISMRIEGAISVDSNRYGVQVTTSVGSFILPFLSRDLPLHIEMIDEPGKVTNFVLPSSHTLEAVGYPEDKLDNLAASPADLLYSTFLGGSNVDLGHSIGVDKAGNAYIVGETSISASDFPTTTGPFEESITSSLIVFVSKFSADGSSLLFSAFLGGGVVPETTGFSSYGIAIDDAENVYVSGTTQSNNFPITSSAFDTEFGGGLDGFVTKLNAEGTALLYSTFLGGSGVDYAGHLTVDDEGNAYVTGYTESLDFPTTPHSFQPTFGGGDSDSFVTKLNPSGSDLVYSTFLGGENVSARGVGDRGISIAVDDSGAVFIAGQTSSLNFPTTPNSFRPTRPLTDPGNTYSFVSKLNPSGSDLIYSTYLSATPDSVMIQGIDVDKSGNAYVIGLTGTHFPTTKGAFQTKPLGQGNAFVTKLNTTGSALVYSTYLGGPAASLYDASSIAVDIFGYAYITGAASGAFPTTCDAYQRSFAGGRANAFVAKLDRTGSNLIYSSYLGGHVFPPLNFDYWEAGYDIALDGAGDAYVTGIANTIDFPTTMGAYDRSQNDGTDVFVAKFALGNKVGPGTYCIFGRVSDSSGNGIAAVTISAGESHNATTDSSGYYTLTSLLANTYTLTPIKSDYTFSPSTSPSISVPPNAHVVNFAVTSAPATYSISGQVTASNLTCASGVTISAGANRSTTTNSGGEYSITSLPAGTYTLTPSKEGCTFSPPTSQPITVPPDATGQNFVGTATTSTSFLRDIVFIRGITSVGECDGANAWVKDYLSDPSRSLFRNLHIGKFLNFNYKDGGNYTCPRPESEPPLAYESIHTCDGMTLAANELKNLIDTLATNKVTIVAHSAGGNVAASLIARNHDWARSHIASVITFDSPLKGILDIYAWAREIRQCADGLRLSQSLEDVRVGSPVITEAAHAATIVPFYALDAVDLDNFVFPRNTVWLEGTRPFRMLNRCGSLLAPPEPNCEPPLQVVDTHVLSWGRKVSGDGQNKAVLVGCALVGTRNCEFLTAPVTQNATTQTHMEIGPGITRMQFSSSFDSVIRTTGVLPNWWQGNQRVSSDFSSVVRITLIAPDGTVIGPNGAGPVAAYSVDDVSEIYEIVNPAPGTWTIELLGMEVASAGEDIIVSALVLESSGPLLNTPPIADAGGPYTATIGELAIFNGIFSYDHTGTIVLYEWDFESDGIFDFSTSNPTATHTYTDDFSAVVTLKVTDNDGNMRMDTAPVAVVTAPESTLYIPSIAR